jgi:hypothetical protein
LIAIAQGPLALPNFFKGPKIAFVPLPLPPPPKKNELKKNAGKYLN